MTRLGSTRARPIDVRFVAATNRDVEADSRQGRFRPDLYFRLNGVALVIPPLRERPQEIEALATSFLSAACRGLSETVRSRISPAALDRASPPRLAGQRPRAAQRHRARRRAVHRRHDPARASAAVAAGGGSGRERASAVVGAARFRGAASLRTFRPR